LKHPHIGWLGVALLLALTIFLATFNGCNNVAQEPEAGAICMTVEKFNQATDEAYANGYARAKAEQPAPPDVALKLWKDKAQVQEFLDTDDCDRCLSAVPGETAAESCLDRTDCLLKHARDAGYDGYGVVLNFPASSHAIAAFPLKGGGIVYAEPWFDQIVAEPKVGEDYLANFNMKGKVIEKVAVFR